MPDGLLGAMSSVRPGSLQDDKPDESEDTMGKLVVTEFVTLDGVMEDPGGGEKDRFDRGGWAFQFDRGDGRRHVQVRRARWRRTRSSSGA